MVLQAYGSAVPTMSTAAPTAGRAGTLKAAAVSGLSLMALTLLVLSHSSALSQPQELLKEDLGQHLMSAFSRDSTEMKAHDQIFETEGHVVHTHLGSWTGHSSPTFDTLRHISSRPVSEAEDSIRHTLKHSSTAKHGWFGKWGNAENFLRKSDRQHSANKWNSQLEKLRQKEAARRRSEDEQYFSGVEKAFGKKAGLAMMAAFDGKSGNSDSDIAKIKLNDKALAARKAQLAHNTQLPHSKDKITDDVRKVIRMKKVVVHKSKATAHEKDEAKKGVSEALKIAQKMGEHKDPVAKEVVKHAKEEVQKPAHKKFDLHHPGVVADGDKIKKLVHEFHHAHGKEKKILKARVMQLQQSIVNDFAKVTQFGDRARTAFQRAEAKEKPKK